MRYYIYISDSKLEMLYEQIPQRKRETIATELNINLGIVQANFSSERVENARHQKILMLEKFLGKRIGTLNDTRPYVADIVTAAWGGFSVDYPGAVYFGGTSNGLHFGLMGSMSNCIGGPNAEPTGYSLSSYVIEMFARRKLLPSKFSSRCHHDMSAGELYDEACRGVIMANQCSIDPQERIRFLARTVIKRNASNEDEYSVYLGSPVYVAAFDE